MEPLFQATQQKVCVMVACVKAPVSPQPHMASNDNAQASQSLLGFSGCFKKKQARKTGETDDGGGGGVLSEQEMAL